MATQNPLVTLGGFLQKSGGNVQDIGGRLAQYVSTYDQTLPDFLAFIAKPENDSVIREFAKHAERMPKPEPVEPPAIIEHIVDTDRRPSILPEFGLEEHRRMGKVKLEKREGGELYIQGSKVELIVTERQRSGLQGHKLRKELTDKPVLNACVLEYLYEHQELIPDSWKGRYPFFWGTIFRDAVGLLYVAYLLWHGERWAWGCSWLGGDWRSPRPAVSAAS